MNLKLRRYSFTPDGIFGNLFDENEEMIATTLEHSYTGNVPKVVAGTYVCKRHAPNRLPYETFEIMNVPDFVGHPVTGILLHIGNFNADSVGCVLLGMSAGDKMITGSRMAFEKFMKLQEGLESFQLVIT